MSHWMEDAAWRKISALAGSEGLAGSKGVADGERLDGSEGVADGERLDDSEGLDDGERLDERPDRSEIIGDRPPPGKPIPPWRWSPLQPREPSEED